MCVRLGACWQVAVGLGGNPARNSVRKIQVERLGRDVGRGVGRGVGREGSRSIEAGI